MGIEPYYFYSSNREYNKNVVMTGRGPYAANRAYVGAFQRSNPPYLDLSKTSKTSKFGSLFNNPEMKRRKRVVIYKLYAVEGKIKASLRNGYRAFRKKCSHIIHGY